MRRLLFFSLILFFARGIGPAFQVSPEATVGRRIALVVGNNHYRRLNELRSAVNDAQSIGAALREAQFDVDILADGDHVQFQAALSRFIEKLGEQDVALFYYSGHGFNYQGTSHLVPVDLAVEQSESKDYSASQVLSRMEARRTGLNILILDACREIPRNLNRSLESRGITIGWAEMHGQRDSFIAYATSPGKTAVEYSADNNGLFTKHLLAALGVPGLKLADVFGRVSDAVRRDSQGNQVPWFATSFLGDFIFRQAIPGSGAVPNTAGSEDAAWSLIRGSSDCKLVRQYLTMFPEGSHASEGRSVVRRCVEAEKGQYPTMYYVSGASTFAWVDRNGQTVFTFNGGARFDRTAGVFSEGLLRLKRSLAASVKWEYVDTAGHTVIPAQFEEAREFHNGLAVVKLAGKYTFVDRTGRLITEPRFAEALDMADDGLAAVRVVDKWGFVDHSGKIAIAARFDAARSFVEGLAAVSVGYEWGYINAAGHVVVAPRFQPIQSNEAALDFSTDGLAGPLAHGTTQGWIDRSGAPVVTGSFQPYGRFSEGVAVIRVNGMRGYVDRSGRTVIAPTFHDAEEFSEDLAAVNMDGRWGYVNKSGVLAIRPSFVEARPFRHGLAVVRTLTGYRYINRYGNFAFREEFTQAEDFFGDLAKVRVSFGQTWIDAKGRHLWDPPGKK